MISITIMSDFRKFRPRPYQKKIIDFILTHKRGAVYAGMGMGKTSSSLAAIEQLKKTDPAAFPVLILAPLRVAVSTWPQEILKWDFNLSCICINGTPKKREKLLKGPRADVYTANYEQLPWLVDYFAAGDEWPFRTVIADESTRLKSFRLGGSKVSRARALSVPAWTRVTRFIELTGTPASNGLIDLWGQMWFIDRGARLGRSFHAFACAYFDAYQVGMSAYAIRYEPREGSDKKIQERIKDVSVSLSAADYFDIQQPIVVPVRVSLPEKAEEFYKTLRRDLLVAVSETEDVTAVNAAALSSKCLQCASGAVYDSAGGVVALHDEKLKALESIIEEANGAPVLVAYHWKFSADAILKKYGKNARLLDKNPETIAEWNRGEIPVLVTNPASAGHGLNLQDGGNILVIFDEYWDLEQYLQVVERIGPTRQYQAGHPRPVYVYHIITDGTLDPVVLLRLQSKRKVQDLLLEYLKGEHDEAEN